MYLCAFGIAGRKTARVIGRCATCMALLVCGPGTAQGDPFCDDLNAPLNLQSRSVVMTLPDTKNTVSCNRSRMLSGGVQLHCGWAFAFRVPEAAQAFDTLLFNVATCLGEDAKVTADLDVNHPDFYDLQTFQLGDQEIAVSLKDKAALSKTYVFLRITLPK
ncbi:MAG: hypothetical protein AB8B71_03865 [Paracoccaceae bacterium]